MRKYPRSLSRVIIIIIKHEHYLVDKLRVKYLIIFILWQKLCLCMCVCVKIVSDDATRVQRAIPIYKLNIIYYE